MKPPTYEINSPIYLLGDHHGYTGEVLKAIAKQSVRNAVILDNEKTFHRAFWEVRSGSCGRVRKKPDNFLDT